MTSYRHTLPLEVKAGSAGVIEGYASAFGGPPDLHGDIILKGAFSESLAEHKAAGTKPAMLWGHSQSEPIGKWLDLSEDDHGLHVRGKLTLSVQKGHDAFELAKDGALGLSVGFRPVRQKAHNGGNLIQAVSLGEVSLVGLAANARAVITSVKSLEQVNTVREFEHIMRDCFGLSVRQAKRLSQGGWEAYKGATTENNLQVLAESIRASAARFTEGIH